MPHVWNISDPKRPRDGVYCMRGGKYGNPFKIGRDGNRDEVCDRFEAEILPTLDVSALRGRDLICCCKPLRCHCDSILRKANRPIKGPFQAAVLDARFKTKPYKHQFREFEMHCETPGRALAWHMRTGKSKACIDKSSHLYRADKIDAVLIFAPNGVHANWVEREFPVHLWEGINATALVWRSVQNGDKGIKRAKVTEREGWAIRREQWWKTIKNVEFVPGLLILSVNTESMTRPDVRKAIVRLLKGRRVHGIFDESDDWGIPGSKRTKMARAVAKQCAYVTIMSGTMTTASPLAAFSQYELIGPGTLGFRTFGDFRVHFADYETTTTRAGRTFPRLIGYKNLEELRELMAPHTSVVLRSEVDDMPDIQARDREIEYTEEQFAAYKKLRRTFLLELGERQISVGELAVRLGKMQQVFSGFLIDEDGVTHTVPGDNPRLDALADEVYSSGGKAVVWCQYKRDFINVRKRLLSDKIGVVEYHGNVPEKIKAKALHRFRTDKGVSALLGHVKSASRGQDFSVASKIINYSHTLSARLRAQSLERATKIGGANIELVDFVCGPPDSYILELTRNAIRLGDDLSGAGMRDLLRKIDKAA